jgi:hypothetical protein
MSKEFLADKLGIMIRGLVYWVVFGAARARWGWEEVEWWDGKEEGNLLGVVMAGLDSSGVVEAVWVVVASLVAASAR